MKPSFESALIEIVSARNVITHPDEQAVYLIDHRQYFTGKAAAVVFPRTAQELSDIIHLCKAHGITLVPQGGNTGYGGGATPDTSGHQILVRLDRLNQILDVDPTGFTMTVQAGTILADVQQAAQDAGMYFPLSLGAEGSCQIGGNIATNAGGLSVLRYGNTRDLVLGLEVVLPDGKILNDMNKLRKNNTGYNLAQLFCGSEGSLGIITAAVLKTFPLPQTRCCLMLAFEDIDKLYGFYRLARQQSGDTISSFEYISRASVDLLEAGPVDCNFPLAGDYRHYALVEFATSSSLLPLQDIVDEILAQAMQNNIVLDGVLASSEKQRQDMWRVREAIPETERLEGGSIKHDISMPLSAIGGFLANIPGLLDAITPDKRVSVYGHIGDGNLHLNLLHLPGADPAQFKAEYETRLSTCIYDLTASLGGSFSAEHGIGQLKLERLKHYKNPTALALMKIIKHTLDPDNTMNPGKLIPPD